MDFITREQARQDIVALGLPQFILDAFDEKSLPYNLDFQFRFPYPILALDGDGQARYGRGRITPIWTGGGDYRVVAYHHDPSRRGYFRFDIETAEDYDPIGMTWQQLLVAEFKFLWELETSVDRLKEIAGWCQFEHIESLVIELRQAKLDTFEKDAAWYHSF